MGQGDDIRLVGTASGTGREGLLRDDELIRLHLFATEIWVNELSNAAITTLLLQNEEQRRTTARGSIRLLLDYGLNASFHDLLVEEAALRASPLNLASSLGVFPRAYADGVFFEVLKQRDTPSKKITERGFRVRICTAHSHHTEEAKQECLKRLSEHPPSLFIATEPHLDYADVGIVEIGPEQLRYVVHKRLICDASQYFKGAFESGFAESRSGRIELREELVQDFGLFLHWLYRRELRLPSANARDDFAAYQSDVRDAMRRFEERQPAHDQEAQSMSSITNSSLEIMPRLGNAQKEDANSTPENDDSEYITLTSHEQRTLLDLFSFADRRGVSQLRNDIMTRLAKNREEGWPLLSTDPDFVEQAYSRLPADSALCRFVVDEAVWCWTKDIEGLEHLDAYPGQFNAAFVRTVVRTNNKTAQPRPSWRYDLCRYHSHADDRERNACSRGLQDWYNKMAAKTSMEPVSELKSL